MRIGRYLITSVECLRRHFDFKVVMGSLKIFIRDLSPERVPYPDHQSRVLYRAIANPEGVAVEGGILKVEEESYTLQHNSAEVFDNPILSSYTDLERIRVVALFELASKGVDSSAMGVRAENSGSDSDIVLRQSERLDIVGRYADMGELRYRLIKVDSRVSSPCKVGDITLEAGRSAWGLFSKHGLYKTLSPIAQNETYIIKLSQDGSHSVVTDRIYKHVERLEGVRAFCTVGRDNYLYIANNRVYSHHDEALGQLLSQSISMLDIPVAVDVAGGKIVITLSDGTEKKIEIL